MPSVAFQTAADALGIQYSLSRCILCGLSASRRKIVAATRFFLLRFRGLQRAQMAQNRERFGKNPRREFLSSEVDLRGAKIRQRACFAGREDAQSEEQNQACEIMQHAF